MVMVVVIQHAGAIKYQASCSADGRTLKKKPLRQATDDWPKRELGFYVLNFKRDLINELR
jgi:hypothetical protein